MTETLKIGDTAPDFSLPATGTASGEPSLSLSAFKGRKLVIFFYPKDNTPGCTTESLEFTAAAKDFDKANTAIVGVSADSLKKHDNFIAKHQLSMPLISDEDHVLLNAFGVWVEKSMYGKKIHGHRTRDLFNLARGKNFANLAQGKSQRSCRGRLGCRPVLSASAAFL